MRFILILILTFNSCQNKSNKQIFSDKNWVVEQQPDGNVKFSKHGMEITDDKGCTVWFKEKLIAPIIINYDATVISEGGKHDRVSDLNCFWMSNDPANPNNFFLNSRKRAGKFKNYHSLKQYYVGYGGHNNSKTRFRRYNGKLNRPLLEEHDLSDNKFMIVPNKKTKITLIVNNNIVKYVRDGETIFEYYDEEPYLSGYFGIRTVNNHMKIENLEFLKPN